jgi:serine protease inhibitor ecotin
MTEVNKLDDKQYPFNPDQYPLAAPIGTSPWALIQVYLGNKVNRQDWCTPDEYIYLVPASGNNAPEIKKRDKHGVITSWQPTQEDLMACDWSLLKIKPKPVDCMLSFDLEVGVGESDDKSSGGWGYIASRVDNWSQPFGSLYLKPNNKIDIVEVMAAAWTTWSGGTISINVTTKPNQESYQNVWNLFQNKNLLVVVDDVIYKLGKSTSSKFTESGTYGFANWYFNDDAHKLGAMLQQNIDKTFYFCLNWVDDK